MEKKNYEEKIKFRFVKTKLNYFFFFIKKKYVFRLVAKIAGVRGKKKKKRLGSLG